MSTTTEGKFSIKLEKRSIDYVEYVEADYMMIASGSSDQVTIWSSGFVCFCFIMIIIFVNSYYYIVTVSGI